MSNKGINDLQFGSVEWRFRSIAGAIRTALLMLTASGLFFGCATANPPLSLEERFERVAFSNDAGTQADYLRKWTWPIRVRYEGPAEYRDTIELHITLLGELTGLASHMTDLDAYEHSDGANMVVRIAPRGALRGDANALFQQLHGRNAGQFTCFATTFRPSAVRAIVSIVDSLDSSHIRLCIVQELTQSLGLIADLDGRTDTNFTSDGNVSHLTAVDRQLIAILYDDRLKDGMRREDAMLLVRQIVAEMDQGLKTPLP